MRLRILSYILFIVSLISCSEGDIITDDIDFTADLKNCSNNTNFVFYKVDTQKNQATSLNFTSTSFELQPLTVPTETTVITLNGTSNTLIHREFSSAIDGSTYFCSSVPPSDNNITNELTGSNGTVEISYTLKDDSDPAAVIYTRTVLLKDITLVGEGLVLRREFLLLGTEDIVFTN